MSGVGPIQGAGSLARGLRSVDSADADVFNRELSTLGAGSAGPSTANPLAALSDYMQSRNSRVRQEVDQWQTGSALKGFDLAVQMIDRSVENALVAKVLAKTVSGINELTKLS